MLTSAQLALSNPSIVRHILLFACFNTLADEGGYQSYLFSIALVTRAWTRPAQAILNEIVRFQDGTSQLKKWLYGAGEGKLSKFETRTLILDDLLPFKQGKGGEKWDFEVIEQVFNKVRGVKRIVVVFMASIEIPSQWFLTSNLKDVKDLILGSPLSPNSSTPSFSLTDLLLYDEHPNLRRDWSHTFSLVGRQSLNGRQQLNQLGLRGVHDYTSLLAPTLPLSSTPFEGNAFPLAKHITCLRLPTLWPSSTLHNLALFGLSAPFLTVLEIETLDSFSAQVVKTLQYIPSLQTLQIVVLVSLPHLFDLQQAQFDRLALEGRSEVIFSLSDLIASRKLSNLRRLEIGSTKFLDSRCQWHLVKTCSEARCQLVLHGGLAELTPEEANEAHELITESRELKRRAAGDISSVPDLADEVKFIDLGDL